MSINLLNHWVDELPEFGTPLRIIGLIEEQRKANEEIKRLQSRVIEIDSEILKMVNAAWTEEEVSDARKTHLRR